MSDSFWNKKDAKEYYRAHEKQIKLFLKVCTKEDKQYFNSTVKELVEILRPYENACIVPSSLSDQLREIRNAIQSRGGEDAVNVVSAQVRLKCPTAWYVFNNLDEPGIDSSDI